MRFLDANVFIYAYVKPKRELTAEEKAIKRKAREVMRRVNGGEKVITTVVHLSEIVNVMEKSVPAAVVSRLLRGILSAENIRTLDVSRGDYLTAADISRSHRIGVNDALAVIKMAEAGVSEIYSFDKHFDGIEGIVRVE